MTGRGYRAALAAALAAAGAIAAASCVDAVTGLRGRAAHLAFAPRFASSGAALVDFDHIRVTVVRAAQGRTVLDTVIAFPADQDSVELVVAVPLIAPAEQFLIYVRLISAAGDTVFRNEPYPQAVEAVAGPVSVVVETVLQYVGIGADAVAVVISTRDTLVFFGDTIALAALAFGADEQPITGTPIAWASLDTARVGIPARDTGLAVGGAERGVARIVARLLTGPSDTVLVTAQPHPAKLVIVSGDGQEAAAGTVLPEPLRVRVTASDGLGVRVPVSFRPLTAGALVTDSVAPSDSLGFAQTTATLASTTGTQGFEASVTGVQPGAFTATATPGTPAQLVFRVHPSTVLVGSAITPAVEVAIADQFGNTVPTWTTPVTVGIGKNSGGAVLGGTLTQAPVSGVATFGDLTLDQPGTGYTLVVVSDPLPLTESVPFNAALVPAVVFAGDSSGGLSSGVFRVNPDGSDRLRLDTRGEAGDVHPRSSPDRRRVAFTSGAQAGGTNQLFVVARSADTVATLLSDTSARRPRWSPDGVRMAFACGDGFSTQQDVCVIPDVTGAIVNLARIGDLNKIFVTDFDPDKIEGPGSFVWDPRDPNYLVVVRDSADAQRQPLSRLYRVLWDGKTFDTLSAPLVDPNSKLPLKVVGPLDWSPDGAVIVFAAQDPLAFDAGTPTGQRLYAIGRDGSGLRQLTKGPAFDERPVSSPDSRQVLFIRDNSCSVDYWIVDVASGAETQVSAEGWCDLTSFVLGHDWSPDGKDLVLVGAETPGTTTNFLIYRVPAGTTAAEYPTRRQLIGRGVDPGGFVTDIQPSWRP